MLCAPLVIGDFHSIFSQTRDLNETSLLWQAKRNLTKESAHNVTLCVHTCLALKTNMMIDEYSGTGRKGVVGLTLRMANGHAFAPQSCPIMHFANLMLATKDLQIIMQLKL